MNLKNAEWLGPARGWWPDFVFHFTDIQNAVSILKEGAIFSRQESVSRGLMLTDNASQEIIGLTDDKRKDHVRLYFRPRTPTQYRNEGFRPPHQREYNAHCPVPVYFLFDSYEVLSRSDSLFTDGNLASNPQIFQDARSLEQIPFEHVYHDSSFTPEERLKIVFHRHAEVIVPKQLDLSALRFIFCRSQAEYETLLHLLPRSVRTRWAGRVGLGNRMNLFFKHWTYVESVELGSSDIVFHFNRITRTPGPFYANVSITDTSSDRRFGWACESHKADGSLELKFDKVGPLSDYIVLLSLNSQLAYADRYQEDLPW